MNVILTIFIAGIVIFILWFVIVLRTGLPSPDEPDRNANPDRNPNPERSRTGRQPSD